MHRSKVLERMSAQIAATEIGFPLIEPELSINIVTNVTFGALNVPFDVEHDIEFFCFDNVMRYSTIASQSSNNAGLSGFQYLHRENHNWQSCDNIPFNSL